MNQDRTSPGSPRTEGLLPAAPFWFNALPLDEQQCLRIATQTLMRIGQRMAEGMTQAARHLADALGRLDGSDFTHSIEGELLRQKSQCDAIIHVGEVLKQYVSAADGRKQPGIETGRIEAAVRALGWGTTAIHLSSIEDGEPTGDDASWSYTAYPRDDAAPIRQGVRATLADAILAAVDAPVERLPG